VSPLFLPQACEPDPKHEVIGVRREAGIASPESYVYHLIFLTSVQPETRFLREEEEEKDGRKEREEKRRN
jgi:hypothetical protein